MMHKKYRLATILAVCAIVLSSLLTSAATVTAQTGQTYLPLLNTGAAPNDEGALTPEEETYLFDGGMVIPPSEQQREMVRAAVSPDPLVCPTPCIGFPDVDANSGRFVNVTRGLFSLGDTASGNQEINITLLVDGTLDEFTLAIFDGDVGGLWDVFDDAPEMNTFRLFADPNQVSNTDPANELWNSTGVTLLDDAWISTTLPVDVTTIPGYAGLDPCVAGNCIYHLVAEWDALPSPPDNYQNNFKVAVEGVPFLLAGSTIGFQGFDFTSTSDPRFRDTTFRESGGGFTFLFEVQVPIDVLQVFDGDFDRADDTDDGNSPALPPRTTLPIDPAVNFPPFVASSSAVVEGVAPGIPQDDSSLGVFRVEPNVEYAIAPLGASWVATNTEPSGTSEWEVFTVAANGAVPFYSPADVTIATETEFPAGFYAFQARGADVRNTLFIYLDYDVLPPLLGQIGDTVWKDVNANGIFEPELGDFGINDVLIELWKDEDEDGVFGPGDTLVATQLTRTFSEPGKTVDGYYLFTDLPLDDYFVVVPTSNFLPGGPLAGLAQTVVPVVPDYATTDNLHRTSPYAVALNTNTSVLLADFGFVDAPAGKIGDFVWAEADANGIFNPGKGESGVPGVQVDLYCDDGDVLGELDANDTFLETQFTDGNGKYLFDDLNIGICSAYIVDIPDSNAAPGGPVFGWVRSPVRPEDLNNYNHPLPLAVLLTPSAPYYLRADFAWDPGAIGDTIWQDSTYEKCSPAGQCYWYQPNGILDAGEPGIAGVQVDLWRDVNGNGVRDESDVVWESQTTDATGRYLFSDLPFFAYVVEIAPANFEPGGALEGMVHSKIRPEDLDGVNHALPLAVDLSPQILYVKADFAFKQEPCVAYPESQTPGGNGVCVGADGQLLYDEDLVGFPPAGDEDGAGAEPAPAPDTPSDEGTTEPVQDEPTVDDPEPEEPGSGETDTVPPAPPAPPVQPTERTTRIYIPIAE